MDPGSGGTQSIDSTASKAHRCAAGGKGGAQEQAIGRSRGGRTTKIHAVADAAGRLIALDLSPGRNTIRQTGSEFSRNRYARRTLQVVGLIGSGA